MSWNNTPWMPNSHARPQGQSTLTASARPQVWMPTMCSKCLKNPKAHGFNWCNSCITPKK